MKRLPLLFLALLTLLLPACGSKPTSYEGRLYFTRQEKDRYRIDWTDPKGEAIHPFLGETEDARGPSVSPDGTRLAYLAGSPPVLHIRSMATGSDEQITKLEGSVSRAAWSPVNNSIAYLYYPPQGRIQLVTQLLGGRTTVVHTARTLGIPTWSRLGNRVYYTETDAAGMSRIFSRKTDGTEPELLVEDASEPAMSPDGLLVAVVSKGKLGLVGISDKQLTTLLDRPGVSQPTWSPSGQQIAFLLGGQIWIVDADGSDVRQVGELPGPALDLAWGKGL